MIALPTPPLRRILIIDDNPAIHQDFRKIFDTNVRGEGLAAAEASFFGDSAPQPAAPTFEIDSAMQGQEGFARVKIAAGEGRPYAMAFVDVRMPPGWDGVETVARLWNLDPDLQVVICTAYSDYSWERMTAKLGHSDRLVVLKKPFDNIEVLQLAHTLTEKRRLLQQVKSELASLAEVAELRSAALVQSEQRFRLIAENAADLISIVDASGRLHYHSPSYEKVLGLTPDLLADPSPAALVHPDDRAKVHAALTSGGGEVIEYRTQHRDGTWRVLEAQSNPVRDAGGKVEHLVLVARDITERKKAEAEHGPMERRLRPAQKLESSGPLAAGIARGINPPQQGLAPALVAGGEAATAAASLEYLAAEIPQAIDLNRAIESTLTLASDEWQQVAEVETDFDPALPLVPCLPGEINQVILNLVLNASHAIANVVRDTHGRKGLISVSTRHHGAWAEIRIADSGTGIPEDIRQKIFAPFSATKGVGQGTGQGLAIAHSVIVDNHGGQIELESEVGKGTSVIVRLPLHRPAQEQQAA